MQAHGMHLGESREPGRGTLGVRAATLGILANLGLIVLKGVIGVVGNSQALIADAIHSGSDLANSVIALVSFLYSRRPADWDHPYGHERAEAFAAAIAAVVITFAGLLVTRDSLLALFGGEREAPSLITVLAAGIAVVVKLGLWRYVQGIAQRTSSQSMRSEARDHFLDIIASLVVIGGILIARLGFLWVDPIAGLAVAGFIFFMAFTILREAARELLDTSLSHEQRHAVEALVHSIPGVQHISGLAGRTIGHQILVELHVDVAPQLSVVEGARIVDAIKDHLIAQMPHVRTVVVELNTDQFEPDALHLDVDEPLATVPTDQPTRT